MIPDFQEKLAVYKDLASLPQKFLSKFPPKLLDTANKLINLIDLIENSREKLDADPSKRTKFEISQDDLNELKERIALYQSGQSQLNETETSNPEVVALVSSIFQRLHPEQVQGPPTLFELLPPQFLPQIFDNMSDFNLIPEKKPEEVEQLLQGNLTLDNNFKLREWKFARDTKVFVLIVARNAGLSPPDFTGCDTLDGMITTVNRVVPQWWETNQSHPAITSMKTLIINHLALTYLPPQIGFLTNLEALDLFSNRLETIPQEIGKLTLLRTLSLAANQLKTIPNEIGQLANLRTLSLADNQLIAIPMEIGQLANLRTLSLTNNQLTAIPIEICQLPKLRELFLHGNPLPSPLPQEIKALQQQRKAFL